MRNVKTSVNRDKLTIVVDLAEEGKPSASGKTLVIASTEGNQSIDTPNGPVTLGLNVYTKR